MISYNLPDEVPTKEKRTRHADEARFLGVCDVHCSPHNPVSYKVNYWEGLIDSLMQIRKYSIQQEVDAVLWGGDIFHLKTLARNPLWFVAEVCSLFKEWKEEGIEQLGIAGNHDMKFGSLEGLKGQPLDVLIQGGNYELLDLREWVFDANGFRTRVAGGSYLHGTADHVRSKSHRGDTYLLSLGHFWYGNQTGELFGEQIYSPEYLGTGEPDLYLIGHHHEDQGVHVVGGKTYVAHGSITRTGSHAADLTRRPAASYITVRADGIQVKVLRPKVPEGSEIIDLEKREQQKQEEKEINEFVEQLKLTSFDETDPSQILESVEAGLEVKNRAKGYLEKAEEGTK